MSTVPPQRLPLSRPGATITCVCGNPARGGPTVTTTADAPAENTLVARDLDDLRRPDARDAACRARPDHRRHRAADHRARPRRRGAPVLGGHRLPARLDRDHAAVGQARRPVRPQDPVHRLHRHLPDRLRPVRHRAEHGPADPVPRRAGRRRRRPDGARAGDHRRRRTAPRPRQVPGRVRRRLRRRQRRRPAARRLLRRQPDAGAGCSTSTCRSAWSRSSSSRRCCR